MVNFSTKILVILLDIRNYTLNCFPHEKNTLSVHRITTTNLNLAIDYKKLRVTRIVGTKRYGSATNVITSIINYNPPF